VIFYNATVLSALYQHYLTIDPEKAKEIVRFSPVAQQLNNFIGKYEFYNREYIVDIQQVIKKIIGEVEIDILAASL
jgi:translation elongation factor EF-Ts